MSTSETVGQQPAGKWKCEKASSQDKLQSLSPGVSATMPMPTAQMADFPSILPGRPAITAWSRDLKGSCEGQFLS